MSANDQCEPTDGDTMPFVISPMPVVWARCEAGDIWWSVELDRYIISNHPEAIDLYSGCLCDSHGFEGDFEGTTGELAEALVWVCGGPMPTGAAVH